MQIGDEIWCHDYRSNRKPWFKETITGETRQSWIVGDHGQYKVNKKTMSENMGAWGSRRWYQKADMDRTQWLGRNGYKIAKAVEGCDDIEVLKKIAELVGYVEPSEAA